MEHYLHYFACGKCITVTCGCLAPKTRNVTTEPCPNFNCPAKPRKVEASK